MKNFSNIPVNFQRIYFYFILFIYFEHKKKQIFGLGRNIRTERLGDDIQQCKYRFESRREKERTNRNTGRL